MNTKVIWVPVPELAASRRPVQDWTPAGPPPGNDWFPVPHKQQVIEEEPHVTPRPSALGAWWDTATRTLDTIPLRRAGAVQRETPEEQQARRQLPAILIRAAPPGPENFLKPRKQQDLPPEIIRVSVRIPLPKAILSAPGGIWLPKRHIGPNLVEVPPAMRQGRRWMYPQAGTPANRIACPALIFNWSSSIDGALTWSSSIDVGFAWSSSVRVTFYYGCPMIPANLTCPRGQHRVYQATAKPTLNIAGANFTFSVRDKTMPGGNLLFQATTAAGDISITDAINGVMLITLSEDMTLQIPGNYFWDLWRTDAGFEDQLAAGNFQIGPSYYQ